MNHNTDTNYHFIITSYHNSIVIIIDISLQAHYL